VNSYLASPSLIPPAAALVNHTLDALSSVVSGKSQDIDLIVLSSLILVCHLATAGKHTTVIIAAGDCFFSSLEKDEYDPSQIYQCETRVRTSAELKC
jgi:hypothetical protein